MTLTLYAILIWAFISMMAIVVCRPSSGRRMFVFTALLGITMLAGLGLVMQHIANEVAVNAYWSDTGN